MFPKYLNCSFKRITQCIFFHKIVLWSKGGSLKYIFFDLFSNFYLVLALLLAVNVPFFNKFGTKLLKKHYLCAL